MLDKSIKKIGIFCLCLAGLGLAGCFHIPDEDWLLSDNEVETGNVEKTDELEQAVNSFMDGIGLVSQQRNEKNGEELLDKKYEMEVVNQDDEEAAIEE